MLSFLSFVAFTLFVALFSWYHLRKEKLDSRDGYFLGGRSLTAGVIAGSMILTNISTEHLIGMNGDAYTHGAIIIGWEVTSAIALVIGALYFIPRYLKMGLTTIPEYLEYRFDGFTRSLVAFMLVLSFAFTLLPIVLYTGAINFESIFDVSGVLGVSEQDGLWATVLAIGLLGSIYAIFGGLKAVAYSDTLNGYGLLIGGLLVPVFALWQIGDGQLWQGLATVYERVPEKFSVVGSHDSVMPFEVLFTGLIVNQLYFWCMNQAIIQRALGAQNLKEAQKGLMLTGLFKILVPIIIVLPGIIGFYYFTHYQPTPIARSELVYPALVKAVLPLSLTGFFAAVVMGAVLSTFNSVLNSAATLFSVDIFQRYLKQDASERQLVRAGKLTTTLMAAVAIVVAPFVAHAPEGLYQLLQTLNGIYFIPIASILLAGFFLPRVSATGAKAAFFFGLAFYVLMAFVFDIDNRENIEAGRFYLHYIHIWGIEFLLNVGIMLAVSHFYPRKATEPEKEAAVVALTPWPYAKWAGLALTIITVVIYMLLR
ncbi:MAG: solute:sodium symporter family transporter [Bacteroidetes bacterium]|nr:MAG: solute:sodium symporter family transporter [Bacteroidota bacterium]